MTQYTPGPWELDGRTIYALHPCPDGTMTGRGADYRPLMVNRFSANVQGSTRNIPEAELDANATLIAAAPELLEALKAAGHIVADKAAGGRMVNTPADAKAVLAKIKQVLAKAEGKQS